MLKIVQPEQNPRFGLPMALFSFVIAVIAVYNSLNLLKESRDRKALAAYERDLLRELGFNSKGGSGGNNYPSSRGGNNNYPSSRGGRMDNYDQYAVEDGNNYSRGGGNNFSSKRNGGGNNYNKKRKSEAVFSDDSDSYYSHSSDFDSDDYFESDDNFAQRDERRHQQRSGGVKNGRRSQKRFSRSNNMNNYGSYGGPSYNSMNPSSESKRGRRSGGAFSGATYGPSSSGGNYSGRKSRGGGGRGASAGRGRGGGETIGGQNNMPIASAPPASPRCVITTTTGSAAPSAPLVEVTTSTA